jgi:hypothetical protein
MLELTDKWLDPWRVKIWDAMYRRDEAESLCLDFMNFQIGESFVSSPESRDALIRAALTGLSGARTTAAGQAMRARVLLTMRCWAARYDVQEASEDEIEALLAMIPESDLDHQNWTYLSFWAFDARNARILGRAYRQFLVAPFDFMVDFSRQRIKVMLQIVEGRTQAVEVAKLIELIPHLKHVEWLRQLIVPSLIEAGEWQPELNAKLMARERELAEAGPQPPPRERVAANFKGNI